MPGSSNQIQIYQGLKIQRLGYVYEVATLQTIDSMPPPVPEIYINDQNPLMSNPEVFIMAFLLLTLPILVYLAYRYGKKMGRKEHPHNENHELTPEMMKRRVSQESTSENSAHYQERVNSRSSSPAHSPNFNSIHSLPSLKNKNDSPLSFAPNKRDFDEKIEELSLDGLSSSKSQSHGQLMLKMNKVDEVECVEEVGDRKLIYKTAWKPQNERKELEGKILKEKLSLDSGEDKVVEKKAQFGVIFEKKKDGGLQKTENEEFFMVFDDKAEVPHTNAKTLKRAPLAVPTHAHSSTNIFTTSPKDSSNEKSQRNGVLALRASSVSPPLIPLEIERRSRSQTEESSKIESVIEKYGVPDETGKFKKIFKDVEFIGEGSFGEVCKVSLLLLYSLNYI